MIARTVFIIGLSVVSAAAQDDAQPDVAPTATDLAILPEPAFGDRSSQAREVPVDEFVSLSEGFQCLLRFLEC